MKRAVPKDIVFKDTSVGRLEKKIWEADEEEIEKILAQYNIPTLSELGKQGVYIQTTPGYKIEGNRKKNDVALIL